jgi:hypothetical protein
MDLLIICSLIDIFLEVLKVLQNKCSSSNDTLDRSKVYIYSSPKAFDFAFLSSYHLIRLFVELGRDKNGLLASCHVAKSKTKP